MRENLLRFKANEVIPVAAATIVDEKLLNFYEFSGATFTLTITFEEAVSFQRLWLKTEGVSSWTATVPGDTFAFATKIGEGIQSSFHSFNVDGETVITFEFTKASGATMGKVYEVMLMDSIFDLPQSERPMRFFTRKLDPGASSYRTEDATLVSYAGQSEGKPIIFIGWDFLPKEWVDRLERLWSGPPLRKPFIIYPEPDDNPEKIYRVYWHNDFEAIPSGKTLAAGYTVNAILWGV